MSKSDNKGDYTVGYGKPPAQHRFEKGRSGNPKGRPRKGTKEPPPLRFRDGHLDDILEQEAVRHVPVHENGKLAPMPAMQAVIRSVIVDGIKGNRLAKKFAFELLRREEQEARSRSLEQYKCFAKLKAAGEAKLAQCKTQGVAPPRLFPHPDDILLDEVTAEAHLLGPLCADQAIPYERGALLRDWYHAYAVLEEMYGKVATIEYEGETAAAKRIVAMIIDNALPPSLRRDERSTVKFLMDLRSLTERQLRQRMQALMAQIATMPDSIHERLTARKGAATAVAVIGVSLEEAVSDLAESRIGRTSGGAPDQR